MNVRLACALPVGVAGALWCAIAPATAHEYWIAPSSYRATAGDTVRVHAWVGTGFAGEARPWTRARAVRFTARGAVDADLRGTSAEGDFVFGRVALADGGGLVVGYESSFAVIELPADEFDHYLEIEGLDEARAARAKLGGGVPGRERYARCAKTWIAGTDATRIRRPLGLPLELVPLTDPTREGLLRVRVLAHGTAVPGVLVRAWRHALAGGPSPRDAASRDSVGPAAEARTGPDGVARLALEGDGEWLVSAVRMTPSADHSVADWESRWASLTFARGPAIRRPVAGR